MPHTKSLLVVMQILLNAHSKQFGDTVQALTKCNNFVVHFSISDNSLTKLKVTLLNYALSFLKIDECVPHVLETVNSIFMFGKCL